VPDAWDADDWSWLYEVPAPDDPDAPLSPETTGDAPPEPEGPPPGSYTSFWNRVFAPNEPVAAPPSTVLPVPLATTVVTPLPVPATPAPLPLPVTPSPTVYSGYSGTGRNDKWKDHSAEDLIQLTVNRYGDQAATLVRLMFDAGYRIEHRTNGGYGAYSVSGNVIRIDDYTLSGRRSLFDASTALFAALDGARAEMETARRNRNIDSMKPSPTATTAVLVDSRDRIVSAEDASGRTLVYYVRTHSFSAEDAPRWLGELITVDGFQYVQRGGQVVPLATVRERAGFGLLWDNSGTTNAYWETYFAETAIDLAKPVAELRLRDVGVDRLVAEVRTRYPAEGVRLLNLMAQAGVTLQISRNTTVGYGVGRLEGRTLILDADRGGLGWNSRTLSEGVDDLLILLQDNENAFTGMIASQQAVLEHILGADHTQWANRMRDEPELAAALRAILDARTWALNTTVGLEQTLVSTAIDLALFAVPADVILAWAWRESRIAADFATSRFTTRTGGSIGAAELRSLAQDYRLNNGARIDRGTLATRVVEAKPFSVRTPSPLIDEFRISSMTNLRGTRGGYVARADYIQGLEEAYRALTSTRDGLPITIRFERFERAPGLNPRHNIRQFTDTAGQVTRHEVTLYLPNNATMYEVLHEMHHLRHHLDDARGFLRLTEEAREYEVYVRMRESPYWQYFSAEEKIDAYKQAARFNPANPFHTPPSR